MPIANHLFTVYCSLLLKYAIISCTRNKNDINITLDFTQNSLALAIGLSKHHITLTPCQST